MGLAAAAASGLVAATAVAPVRRHRWLRGSAWVLGLSCGATLFSYLHGTLRGKFRIWAEELDRLALRGDETVVDLGCGRGVVLLAAAARLPRGRAVGVDVWRGVDQSGNGPAATRANAAVLGVVDRVELHTADVRHVPLPGGCADVVVSSLVLHNLPDEQARSAALGEAVRLLRPGGRLVLLDIAHVDRYAEVLTASGLLDVHHRNAGWRYFVPPRGSRILTATRPR
jgi:SAM-dependent methyltransferase